MAELANDILRHGKLAFDPDLPERHVQNFEAIINSKSTLALLPALNLLVQPGRAPAWLRTPLIAILAQLPLRPHGVQDTIEFVLSVHPSTSSANKGAQVSTGRGAAISHEALNAISRLLSSPPAGMEPEHWFLGIAPELFSLLRGEGEPGMDKAAAFVIGFGVLGRKQYGAPGMAGWRAFVDPIYRCIHPSRSQLVQLASERATETVITLNKRKILVSAHDLALSLQRLSTLLASHPNPALTQRLLNPLVIPLWSLSSWHVSSSSSERIYTKYRKPAEDLLKTLIQLSPESKGLETDGSVRPLRFLSEIVENLMKSTSDPSKVFWTYTADNDGGIQVEVVSNEGIRRDGTIENGLSRIDGAVESFVSLIGSIPDFSVEISTLFLYLFGRWIKFSNSEGGASEILMKESSRTTPDDAQARLIEAKIMQQMMTAFPDKLVEDSMQVLHVVGQVLSDFVMSEDGKDEDTAGVGLSLLNLVLTSPNFRIPTETGSLISSIQASLKSISMQPKLKVSATAQNLLLLMNFHSMTDDLHAAIPSLSTNQHLEDRKSYNLAMSYLTAIDSPPPVRAQGLELINGLVKSNSSILDIPALLVLFSSILQDHEDYLYLRSIKSLVHLSEQHPKAVMKDLVDRYVDQNEEAGLDQRLRLGEAVLQVIQHSPLSFNSDTSRSVCEGLLFIASRRGKRPKTEHEQQKAARFKQKQDRAAEAAWEGPVPQLDEVLEIESTPDQEMLTQIVGGWESKRGSEDVRIRASALSILGSAIEANVAGIASQVLATAIDLSIHILTLEPEPEKGIIRRAAILLIMSFVKALDDARSGGRKLGFGFMGQSLEDVLRVLGYVEEMDNDDLVRQHARDVIEGLQTWQVNALIPPQNERTGIQELAGLSITPNILKNNDDSGVSIRPRIEEVE